MQDWRKVGKKLLFPPVWIITLLTVICTVTPVAIYDILTGAGISVAVVTMAIYMIVQTTREIKQYKHNKE